MVDIIYANAYKEVIEILKCVSKEDYDKIPKDKIELFEANANKNFNFTYDINKTLDEQNVSKKAKTIIAILFRDYWATPYQKERIEAKEKYDLERLEEEKREKYNPDNIFKNRQHVEINTNSNLPIEVKKENFFKKLINFIKRIIIK